jgi:AcrR family transcriptional regulator
VRLSAQLRRQRLIEAAGQLFSQRGYDGVTTRQIALKAGVTEAMVFRHFPKKEDLYWAVIDDRCEKRQGRANMVRILAEHQDDDRALFSSIAFALLERNTKDSTLPRLLMFSALERHELSYRFFRTYIAENYELVAQHIRRRIREGRFRAVDPLLAARGFVGMVFYHFMIQELYGAKRYQKFDLRRVADEFTDIWLAGMRTANGNSLHTSNGKRHHKNGRALPPGLLNGPQIKREAKVKAQ